MPFQPPVRPAMTSTRAGGSEAAGGSMPVLDQSASRQLGGCSVAAKRIARATIGSRKRTSKIILIVLTRGCMGGEVKRLNSGASVAVTVGPMQYPSEP